ncbi:hypothetical protein PGQ11_009079 [Apiospora arundinis]|uniref:Uncharacterized protein n=1 Tax=Apiospora arundinis TaxID=335852 RepID=A0ABR2IH09_9PEZI
MLSSGLRPSRRQQELNEKPGLLLVAAALSRTSSTTNRVQSPTGLNHVKSESSEHDGPSSHKRPYPYDWATNVKASNARLSLDGIKELPMSQVGRIIEGGRTTSLYNIDKYGTQHFLSYDGSDVYARIPRLYMKDTVGYQSAALHIGKLHHCEHPADIELDMHWNEMKDGSWAVHVHPKAGSGPKKARS